MLGLLAAHSVLAAKKADAAKDDLKDVHEKIESLKKELDASTDAHKDAADALKASETAISKAQKKLHEISLKQKQNSVTLTQLKQQSLRINDALSDQQQQLSQQLYQQYLHGNQSYTQLMLENKDPNAIARDLKYFAYIAKARSQLINEMQGNLRKVESLNDETAAKLNEVAALKQKQEEEKKALLQQKQEKAKVVQSLSQKIAAQRSEISKLKRDEKNLSNLVERLAKLAAAQKKKQLAQQKAKAKSAKKASGRPNTTPSNTTQPAAENQTIARNETLPDNDVDGVHFPSLRGKLRLPVRGEVSNRFGAVRSDTGVSWKGLFIRANEGNEVKSIASGRIVFADWMRGFGNLIIVDHGSGYMSLYGNNQALLKNVGEKVSGGDTIAAVGNSGGNESNGLYYELRRNSVPFDPLSWSNVR
ncbi:murein hydrolase activator EnvC [Methylotenera sp. 1P/1]|uniref:murein hydrolase activator EnvC family protein n=1 Tax=Methylotenera sp. 1P/1 TaxID=1131551 RepID=UPI00035CB35E|nr:peptidoglycan DD-metalloendopeptidase family protein [Methylotenera sp. 1P/1]